MVTVIIQKESKGQKGLGFPVLHTKTVIISISRIMMESSFSSLPLLGHQEDQDSGHKLHKWTYDLEPHQNNTRLRREKGTVSVVTAKFQMVNI